MGKSRNEGFTYWLISIEYGLRNKERDVSQCAWYFAWKFYGLIPMLKKKNEMQVITPDEGSVIICNLQTGRAKAEITSFKVTRGTVGSLLKCPEHSTKWFELFTEDFTARMNNFSSPNKTKQNKKVLEDVIGVISFYKKR